VTQFQIILLITSIFLKLIDFINFDMDDVSFSSTNCWG